MDGFFSAEHQDAGQRKTSFSGLTVFPPSLNLLEELHIVGNWHPSAKDGGISIFKDGIKVPDESVNNAGIE